MVFSRFNIFEDSQEYSVVFNTFNKVVTVLSDQDSQKLRLDLKSKVAADDGLKKFLIEKGVLISKDEDELQKLMQKNHNNKDILNLYLVPTSKCNLNCRYCFMKTSPCCSDSEDLVSDTVEFIKNNVHKYNGINVVWFGGEPLLAMDKMEEITSALKNEIEQEIFYSSTVITNGVLLDEANILRLKEIGVKRVQIVVDCMLLGNDEYSSFGYQRFFSNIKNVCEKMETILRVDYENIERQEVKSLFADLIKSGCGDKVQIYLSSRNGAELSRAREYFDNIIHALKKVAAMGMKYAYSVYNPSLACAVVYDGHYIVDSTGNIYKCALQIGKPQESVGTLKEGIEEDRLSKWQLMNAFTETSCMSCSIYDTCKNNKDAKRWGLGLVNILV